jgi:hypothetical protein
MTQHRIPASFMALNLRVESDWTALIVLLRGRRYRRSQPVHCLRILSNHQVRNSACKRKTPVDSHSSSSLTGELCRRHSFGDVVRFHGEGRRVGTRDYRNVGARYNVIGHNVCIGTGSAAESSDCCCHTFPRLILASQVAQ